VEGDSKMSTPKDNIHQWKKWKWIVYGSLALPYLIVYFHRVALNVVAQDLSGEFKITGAVLGTLAAMYFYVYTLMQIPAGVLADYWGPRRTATTGMLLAGMGAFLFGIAKTDDFLFFGRIIISIGVSVIFISILKVQSEWFQTKEFALLSGLTVFIGNAGAVLASTPLVFLVHLFNWRISFLLISGVSLLAAFITWQFTKDTPNALGLSHPDTLLPKQNGRHFENEVTSLPKEKPQATRTSIRESVKLILLNRWSWPLLITFFGVFGSFLTFQGVWGVPYFMHVFGMSEEAAANHLLVASLGHMIGSIAIGFLSDHIGRRKPAYIGFLTALIVSWTLLTVYPFTALPVFWLYPLSFLIGFCASCLILTWGWAKEVNHPDMAGIAMGTTNMAGFLGAAIMQSLFGFILDKGWGGTLLNGARVYTAHSYAMGFLVSLASLIISLICVLVMVETKNKNIYKQIQKSKGFLKRLKKMTI
jgi:sugar phosphate permease